MTKLYLQAEGDPCQDVTQFGTAPHYSPIGADTLPGELGGLATLGGAASDAILYWDFAASAYAWATVGTGLDLTAGVLTATGAAPAWGDITGIPALVDDLGALTDPGADRLLFWNDGTNALDFATVGTGLDLTAGVLTATGGGGGGGAPVQGCRLTLWSGDPYSLADRYSVVHIFLTPAEGGNIFLYDGASWVAFAFSEVDVNVTGLGTSIPADLFAYDTGSGVGVSVVLWSDATTRASALALQDGFHVLASDHGKLYVGTVYLDSSGQLDDTMALRRVWNRFNPIWKPIKYALTGNWSVSASSSWAQYDGVYVSCVSGLKELSRLTLRCSVMGVSSTAAALAIGIDGTNPTDDGTVDQMVGMGLLLASLDINVPDGYHEFKMLQWSYSSASTFYGSDTSPDRYWGGMYGMVKC